MGKLRKKYPDLLKGKDAWTSDWGSTRRMVIGPFASESGAKSFYGDCKKAGGDGYVWHRTDGLAVEKLTETLRLMRSTPACRTRAEAVSILSWAVAGAVPSTHLSSTSIPSI